MPLPKAAALAFAAYTATSLLVGESFPFSPFAMYSHIVTEPVAVPAFVAGGEAARPEDFGCFEGVDAELVKPPSGVPYSSQYVWQAWRLRVVSEQEHPSGRAADVPVEFGHAILRRDAEGRPVLDPPVVLTRGLACRR